LVTGSALMELFTPGKSLHESKEQADESRVSRLLC
jgi:hypothetical protein